MSFDANKIKLIKAWLDAQRVNRYSARLSRNLVAIISAWCGMEVTEEEINKIIDVHPRVNGTANKNNISRRLTCPCDSRLSTIDIEVKRKYTPKVYEFFESVANRRTYERINEEEWKRSTPGQCGYEPPEELIEEVEPPKVYEGPPISAKKFILMHTASLLNSIEKTSTVSILGKDRESEVKEESKRLAVRLMRQALKLER